MRGMQQHLMQMQPMMAAYYPNNVTTDHIQQVISSTSPLYLFAFSWLSYLPPFGVCPIYLFLGQVNLCFCVYPKAAYFLFDFCFFLIGYELFLFDILHVASSSAQTDFFSFYLLEGFLHSLKSFDESCDCTLRSFLGFRVRVFEV